jgi:Mrp family chromosome partitioning ATPase/capsular polysaccharide biosynthesis protein
VSSEVSGTPLDSVSLRDQFAVIGRRWRIIAAGAVIGLAAGAFYVAHTPTTYTSHTEVVVRSITIDPFAQQSSQNSVNMATEQRVASAGVVAQLAATTIGSSLPPQLLVKRHLQVSNPLDTQVLDFAYTDSTPQQAQIGSGAFAEAYLANRTANAKDSIAALRTHLSNELDKAEADGEPSSGPVVQGLANQINQLDGIDTSGGTISQAATLPRYRAGPRHSVVLAGGLLIGVILGLVAAFVRDATDDRLRGPKQLAEVFGAPVLARVPVARRLPWEPELDLTADGSRHPKVAEAYRTLASRLLVAGATDSIQSILIASPATGEGRSSVAANLATTLVELGYGVWVVSADLRPPQVHRLLGVVDDDEMVDVVRIGQPADAERKASREIVLHMTPEQMSRRQHHLTLVSSSSHLPAPGRLISPLAMAQLVEENKHFADITIVDAPPLLEYADAVPLLPRVDAVLVVADASLTKRTELEELADLLVSTRSRVVGSVLNRDGSRVASRRARRARRRLSERRGHAGHRAPRSPRSTGPTYEPPGAELEGLGGQPQAGPHVDVHEGAVVDEPAAGADDRGWYVTPGGATAVPPTETPTDRPTQSRWAGPTESVESDTGWGPTSVPGWEDLEGTGKAVGEERNRGWS